MNVWRLFLILLFLVFPFGQLARINLLGSEVVIHANDLVVGIFVICWLFVNRKNVPPILKKDSLTKPLLIFMGVCVVSLLVNFPQYTLTQIAIAALYPLRFLLYAGLYFVIKNSPESHKKLVNIGLIVSVLAVAVIGLGQYILLPDTSFLAAAAWDDHYFRLVFPFLDPGFTGAILVLGLLFLYTSKFSKKIISMVIIFVAMMLTYSRATYLMYLVSFAVLSWYKKSLKLLVISFAVLIIAIPLLPKSTGEGTKLRRENSIFARINNWKESMLIWETKPIFGAGFNAYRYARPGQNSESHAGAGADSSVLLVLATTGIVGLLAYLYLLKTVFEVNKNNVLIIASFLGIFVHSWFNNTLFYPWVMEWLWILLVTV